MELYFQRGVGDLSKWLPQQHSRVETRRRRSAHPKNRNRTVQHNKQRSRPAIVPKEFSRQGNKWLPTAGSQAKPCQQRPGRHTEWLHHMWPHLLSAVSRLTERHHSPHVRFVPLGQSLFLLAIDRVHSALQEEHAAHL